MKTLTSFFFLFPFLFSGILNAQETEIPLKLRTVYPGYVVTTTGDTIHGFPKFMTLISNQVSLLFYDNEQGKGSSEKFKTKDLLAYMVGGVEYERVPFTGMGLSRKQCFMIREASGHVSLYRYFFDKSTILNYDDIREARGEKKVLPGELKYGIQEQLFGVKKGEKPVDFNSSIFILNFKKRMSKYVADCPELSEKIFNKNEGYYPDNVINIIREYNACLQPL